MSRSRRRLPCRLTASSSVAPSSSAERLNALRGHLAAFGIVAPQGAHGVSDLTARRADPGDDVIPAMARAVLQVLVAQLRATERPPSGGSMGWTGVSVPRRRGTRPADAW